MSFKCIKFGVFASMLAFTFGASAQQRWVWLSNELVNGIQTAIAAVLALLLAPLVLAAAS